MTTTTSSPPCSPKPAAKQAADPRPSARRRTPLFLRLFAVAVAFGLGISTAEGYHRIVLGGKRLKWPTSIITWQLHAGGSDNIADGSHVAALEHAFAEWASVPGSKVRFQRGQNVASKNPSSNSHVVAFDENNGTGYFPSGSGIVAITPLTYDPANGTILDADILFNGRDYAFGTGLQPGSFDVQDVATHEIGHFIGLDHAPSVSGTMWPYVSPGQWLHRSLSEDDAAGAVAVVSKDLDSALFGTIRHEDGSGIRGGSVYAVDANDGRLVAAAASDHGGSWRIRGLPAGDYHVYAAPLEGGISAANLTGDSQVQTDFGAGFYGSTAAPLRFTLGAATSFQCGDLWLPANNLLVDSTSSAQVLEQGGAAMLTLWGSNFSPNATEVWSLSPWITLSNVTSGSSWVQARLDVAGQCPPGVYDLYLHNAGGDFEAVSAVLDVTRPAPALAALDATRGGTAGGSPVVLHGADFQEGAWVLFGGIESPLVEWVDPGQLRVFTPAHEAGLADVVVVNPDGRQTRLPGGYLFEAMPVLAEVFPTAGQQTGGTSVLLQGAEFAPDLEVYFDGSPALVQWQSPGLAKVVAPAHVPGSVDLLLRNPGMPELTVADAFTYVVPPDPVVHGMTPSSSDTGGGANVRLSGTGLDAVTEVRFGVNSASGGGGKSAVSLQVLGASAVQAVTPSFKTGNYSVRVTTGTGQGVLAPGKFQFQAAASSGGGGGGCGGVIRPGDRRDPIGDAPAWLLLLGGWWLYRRRSLASHD
ncbi:MAG TPA: IPT/TIG domain-containing protein [Planctomycetota bacterium]